MKCIDEEIPFEIPNGWEWCRIGNIIKLISGQDFPPERYNDNAIGIPYITGASNILNNNLVINRWTSTPSVIATTGDLLMVCKGSGVGKMCKVKIQQCHIARQIQSIRDEFKVLNLTYIEFFLLSSLNDIVSKTQGVIPGISRDVIQNLLFPVPPLMEQEQIVLKIEYILPILEKYSISQEKLDKLNIEINDKLRKSILQEAIQGKLVPQIAEEGTAQELLEQIKEEKQKLVKAGKLKKSALTDSVIYKSDDNKYYEQTTSETTCIDEEIPFEIPSTWVWVRLDQICSYIQRGKSPKYSLVKQYPVIAQKCNQWSGFSIERAQYIEPSTITSYGKERFLQDNDLMWNSTGLGTLGRMAIYKEAANPYELAVADSHVTVIRPIKDFVRSEYLYFYFASNTVQSVIEDKSDGSTKQKELSTATVKNYLVPLPPTMEQDRIISQVNLLVQQIK